MLVCSCRAHTVDSADADPTFCSVQGYLLPGYQRLYWIGLTTTLDTWPSYLWIDRSMPGPQGYYSHWGKTRVQGASVGQFALMQEPMDNTATCATAAKQQAFGFPSAWGWISTQCSFEAVYVCRRPTKVSFTYNSTAGTVFIFNSTTTSQADADRTCKEAGARLTSYISAAEQVRAATASHLQGGRRGVLSVAVNALLHHALASIASQACTRKLAPRNIMSAANLTLWAAACKSHQAQPVSPVAAAAP